MPKLDKTGPQGQGPRTGRGFGVCPPGYGPHYGYGRGMGRGWRGCGFGPGWGWGYPANISPKEEREILKEELNALNGEIKDIQARLEELKKDK